MRRNVASVKTLQHLHIVSTPAFRSPHLNGLVRCHQTILVLETCDVFQVRQDPHWHSHIKCSRRLYYSRQRASVISASRLLQPASSEPQDDRLFEGQGTGAGCIACAFSAFPIYPRRARRLGLLGRKASSEQRLASTVSKTASRASGRASGSSGFRRLGNARASRFKTHGGKRTSHTCTTLIALGCG